MPHARLAVLTLALTTALAAPEPAPAQTIPIGGVCSTTAQCDDGRFCTGIEVCLTLPFPIGSRCTRSLPPCRPTFCDELVDRCTTACTSDAACDDGLFCNGTEGCIGRRCLAGLPVDCSDDVACTVDGCSESTRSCTHISPDADRDGHGAASCMGDDCDDGDPTRFPGDSEICDGDDEDCDPETFGTSDDDGDSYVDQTCCNGSSCGGDCDDDDSGVHPNLPEVCNDVDDDCNGDVDEGVQVSLFVDFDADGHGAAGTLAIAGCPGDPGMSTLGNDCDDKYPAIQPGALMCDPLGPPDAALLCSSDGEFVPTICASGSCIPQPNRLGICQACTQSCGPPGDPLPPP